MTIVILILLLFGWFTINVSMMMNESKSSSARERKSHKARDQRARLLILIFTIVLLGFGISQPDLRAEELVWGEVKSVYLPNYALTMKKFDPRTQSFEEVAIEVSRTVELNEFASLGDLHPGDEIVVAGETDEKTGKWTASLIDLRESYKSRRA